MCKTGVVIDGGCGGRGMLIVLLLSMETVLGRLRIDCMVEEPPPVKWPKLTHNPFCGKTPQKDKKHGHMTEITHLLT